MQTNLIIVSSLFREIRNSKWMNKIFLFIYLHRTPYIAYIDRHNKTPTPPTNHQITANRRSDRSNNVQYMRRTYKFRLSFYKKEKINRNAKLVSTWKLRTWIWAQKAATKRRRIRREDDTKKHANIRLNLFDVCFFCNFIRNFSLLSISVVL